MSFESWAAFYASDAQAVYAPLVAPALFLLVRLVTRSPSRPGVAPESARFVRVYAVVFAVETLLDPLATGPLVRAAGLYGGSGGRAVLLPFVLLGDFRVFLLVFALAAPAAGVARAARAAGLATLVVPAFALGANAALEWIAGDLHENSIWLAYELSFVAMALYLRFRFVPARVGADRPELRGYLRAITGYVAIYYALWAGSDALIQLAGLDWGWALRILPNQLYYGFWVPFAFFAFFARTGNRPGGGRPGSRLSDFIVSK